MKLEALLFDNRNNKLFDVSQLVGDVQISTYLEDQPGKLTFQVLKYDDLAFWEGATISLKLDDVPMFKGYIFSKKRNKYTNIINITAYDQLRYLKNKDSYVFQGKTSSQIFSKICNDFMLKYKIVDASSYICAPRVNDAKPLYDMIKSATSDTLINTGNWFIIRDNFGVLEHVSIKSLYSGLLLGDEAGITDFEYETSIDKESYNQVKLYRDDKKNNKREVFVINDTATKNAGKNLKEWGVLQLYQSVESDLNAAQIKQRAEGLLERYDRLGRTLSLDCLGFPNIGAGNSISCRIKDLGDISLDSVLLIKECTHKIQNQTHSMNLTVEVVQ